MKYTLQESTICNMIKSDMLWKINYSSWLNKCMSEWSPKNSNFNVFQNEHTHTAGEAGDSLGTLSQEKFNLNIIKSK